MKAIEQHFADVLFIVLRYTVVLTFESVDEILMYGHQMKAIEQYLPVLFSFYAVQGGFNF